MMKAYIDSSVWITRFEGIPSQQLFIQKELLQLQNDGWILCISEAVLLEVFYKPKRNHQLPLLALYHQIFSEITQLPNYEKALRDAIEISPMDNLKSLDAIHVALARHHGCELFVSTDQHFKNLVSLRPLLIDFSQKT